jgi:coproporphyrinogen III oxidase-like Fe-S oxidoreductase
MAAMSQKRSPITDGFLMCDEERRRKAVVLNLIDLDMRWYAGLFGNTPDEDFKHEFEFLKQESLLNVSDMHARLTERGVRHRDTIVQLFFSERVRRLVTDHSYDE